MDGYTFAGWRTQDGKTVNKYTTVKASGDHTLYAQWTVNTYTVQFDGNGSTGGSMEDLKDCRYDTSYTLPANTYEKEGFVFAGWNTKADGSGKNRLPGGKDMKGIEEVVYEFLELIPGATVSKESIDYRSSILTCRANILGKAVNLKLDLTVKLIQSMDQITIYYTSATNELKEYLSCIASCVKIPLDQCKTAINHANDTNLDYEAVLEDIDFEIPNSYQKGAIYFQKHKLIYTIKRRLPDLLFGAFRLR